MPPGDVHRGSLAIALPSFAGPPSHAKIRWILARDGLMDPPALLPLAFPEGFPDWLLIRSRRHLELLPFELSNVPHRNRHRPQPALAQQAPLRLGITPTAISNL